ncbi:hypothetical protein E8E12_006388 [Didymella heteroderae]|uniref:Protein kinase domain-containing protein n=1 Tax=Didymella heteroderae TaxID=1769908 RepID=A0A9P4WZZ2_9PLEO|nr:hypothetical protein E8E12_006388 [Didymella heteroderae]
MANNGCEELMQAWFSNTKYNQRKIETDIRGIAEVLERTANVSWSRIPRIYSVLRIIDQLQVIECFLTEGVSDVGFPFTSKSLPSSLRDHATRSAFLAVQELVFNTRAQDLEREKSRHGHFRDLSDIPFKKVEELGKGAYGFVDRVISTISHKEYARKLIPRGKNFRKDKDVLRNFERELSNLKRISTHKHIVQLVASYTDPKYVGIITSPVADCNLHEYLQQQLDSGKRSFLRGFFGCLTIAIRFLHDNKVRHKDIKPQNVLVKGECIFLTDFGLSLDWSERNHSITTGPSVATPRYAAPEVASQTPRNSSADIWSLGCVFLEMWTVLRGESKQSLELHLATKGSHSTQYCNNSVGLSTWIEAVIRRPGSAADNAPVKWIKNMLQREGAKRWTAHQLEEQIQLHDEDDATPFAYTGRCCSHDEDTEGSVYSTCDEDLGVDIECLQAPLSEKCLEQNGAVHRPTITPETSWDLPAALKVSHLFQEVDTTSLPMTPLSLQQPTLIPSKEPDVTPLRINTCFKTTEEPAACVVEAFDLDNEGNFHAISPKDEFTAKPREADPSPRQQPVKMDDGNLNDHDSNEEREQESNSDWDVSDMSQSEISEIEHIPQHELEESGLEKQRSSRFPPPPYVEDETVSLARETVAELRTEDHWDNPSSWDPEEHAFNESNASNAAREPVSGDKDGNAQHKPKDHEIGIGQNDSGTRTTEGIEHHKQTASGRMHVDGEETRVEAGDEESKPTRSDKGKLTGTAKPTVDDRKSTLPQNKTTSNNKTGLFGDEHPTIGHDANNTAATDLTDKRWVFFSSGTLRPEDCKLCSNFSEYLRLRCGQYICVECLRSKISLAIRYPQHMPPMCGNMEIILSASSLTSCLGQELAKDYIRKYRAYKSYYPYFCQPTQENVLVCPAEMCKSRIIPSKVRVDQQSGKKDFNAGLHDTEDDQDVFPITAQERGYDPTRSRDTEETPTYPIPPQYASANLGNLRHEGSPEWHHSQQRYADSPYGHAYTRPLHGYPNPFAEPKPNPYAYSPYWNSFQAPPQPQYQTATPPFSNPYPGYYAAPPRQPSPPPQHNTKERPRRHRSDPINNIWRDSPLNHDNRQPEAANYAHANDEYESDLSEKLHPPLRTQRSHRRTRNNTMHDDRSYMSTANSRTSAVAVINKDRESAQAGLSYDDALNSPERILEWLLHVCIDHDATQQTNWADEGLYNDNDGYTDSSDTFIESDDDYWDTVEA